jgi:hypothetical protein
MNVLESFKLTYRSNTNRSNRSFRSYRSNVTDKSEFSEASQTSNTSSSVYFEDDEEGGGDPGGHGLTLRFYQPHIRDRCNRVEIDYQDIRKKKVNEVICEHYDARKLF